MPSRETLVPIVVFTLEEFTCGFPLAAVRRVHRAVEVTSLPGAPVAIKGVVDLNGAVVPVFDFRVRLGLEARPIRSEDRFILTWASRLFLVTADSVLGLEEVPPWGSDGLPDHWEASSPLKGVARDSNGLILIYDLDQFLSKRDEVQLDKALGAMET